MWDFLSPLDVMTMAGYAVPRPMACERNRFALVFAAQRKRWGR